jgi:hypothetical protein
MKRSIIGTVMIAGLTIELATMCGCTKTSARLDNPSLAIDSVRGDSLGMTLKQYEKRHPDQCLGDLCTGIESYAGVPARKQSIFTKDGKLWQIYYSVDDQFADQLLAALKEKYGDPGAGCVSYDGHTCRWSNGKASVRFSHAGKNAVAEFTENALASQASEEYSRDRTAKRKTDQ